MPFPTDEATGRTVDTAGAELHFHPVVSPRPRPGTAACAASRGTSWPVGSSGCGHRAQVEKAEPSHRLLADFVAHRRGLVKGTHR